MDIEQTKMILNSLSEVKDGALWIYGLTLTKDLVVTSTGWGVLIYGITKVTVLIRDCVYQSNFNEKLSIMIGSYGYPSRDEQRRIIDLVQKGLDAEKTTKI